MFEALPSYYGNCNVGGSIRVEKVNYQQILEIFHCSEKYIHLKGGEGGGQQAISKFQTQLTS